MIPTQLVKIIDGADVNKAQERREMEVDDLQVGGCVHRNRCLISSSFIPGEHTAATAWGWGVVRAQSPGDWEGLEGPQENPWASYHC